MNMPEDETRHGKVAHNIGVLSIGLPADQSAWFERVNGGRNGRLRHEHEAGVDCDPWSKVNAARSGG
jgi:hypothetical protein